MQCNRLRLFVCLSVRFCSNRVSFDLARIWVINIALLRLKIMVKVSVGKSLVKYTVLVTLLCCCDFFWSCVNSGSGAEWLVRSFVHQGRRLAVGSLSTCLQPTTLWPMRTFGAKGIPKASNDSETLSLA